jgi:hypothetical protein
MVDELAGRGVAASNDLMYANCSSSDNFVGTNADGLRDDDAVALLTGGGTGLL